MRSQILVITPFSPLNLGGAETFASDLMNESRKSHSVNLVSIRGKIVNWKGLPFGKALFIIPELFFKGLNMCLRNRTKTIVALGLIAGMTGVLLKSIFRTRLLIIPLAIYNFKDRPFFSVISGLVLRQADMIFCESNISRNDLYYTGIQWRKTELFTHWVDQTKFFPIEHENAHLKVLFVGRPIPEKGKHIIQEVEKELWEVDFEYVEDVKYEDLPRHYQMADVLVVPSVYNESPNRIVVEGAACGCVVIVSDKGALPEQVGGFGIITKPAPKYFKYHIAVLASDRKKLKTFREITIRYAQEHFTERNAQTIMREF